MSKIRTTHFFCFFILIIVLFFLLKDYNYNQEHFDSLPQTVPTTRSKELSIPKCVSDCNNHNQRYPNMQPACKIICPPKIARYYNENLMQYN